MSLSTKGSAPSFLQFYHSDDYPIKFLKCHKKIQCYKTIITSKAFSHATKKITKLLANQFFFFTFIRCFHLHLELNSYFIWDYDFFLIRVLYTQWLKQLINSFKFLDFLNQQDDIVLQNQMIKTHSLFPQLHVMFVSYRIRIR